MASFQPGDIVRLTGDKTYEGTLFPKGTLGTVVADIASLGACLVMLGHDTTSRLVPAHELSNANAPQKASTTGNLTKVGLRFRLNSRVTLRAASIIGGVAYSKGSPGRIAAVLESFNAYLVDFDQDSTDRMLADAALDPE